MAKNAVMSRDFPVEHLTGGHTASQAIVLRGMTGLERELTAHFKDRRRDEAALARAMRPQQAAMESVLKARDPDGASIKALQALDRSNAKRRLAAPQYLQEQSRIFAGSIGATVAPPFNYQWNWNTTSGGPQVSVGATASNGAMNFGLWTNGRRSSASAAAAVGIYFRPAVANGILKIWANPALNYNWWTSCAFASAHSDGWTGLYVGRYTLAGGFDGAPVSQKRFLWNDDSWWSGASDSGSTSGYPLSAQINVDRSHWYAIWVWCGGSVSGAGSGFLSYSGAGAYMTARVPSMTWELF